MKNYIRKIPHFKGKFRLVKLLFGRYLANTKDVVIRGRYGLSYKLPNLKEVIGFEVFSDGIYEKETSDFILGKLPPNAVMIDIGANIGTVAIPICAKRPDIKVFCIEGSPRVFNYLQINLGLNNIKNCIVINKIITDSESGVIDFFSPEGLFGKGSMSPVFTQKAEHVDSISLDGMVRQHGISEVNFIKIDIEGYEYHAFKGGKALLSSPNAPDILFEFLDWGEALVEGLKPGDAQKLILEYGYKLFKIEDKNKLSEIYKPILKGSAMLFATKKQ